LQFGVNAAAVNYLQINNNSTGNNPRIRAVGDDANVNFSYETQGGGFHYMTAAASSVWALRLDNTGATNPFGIYLKFANAADNDQSRYFFRAEDSSAVRGTLWSDGTWDCTAINFGQDDLNYYDEGTWTPVLTFATPGDLSVAYSSQAGFYTRTGNRVVLQCYIATSTFTHSTASGNVNITGLPFTSANVSLAFNSGAMQVSGVTKASYTSFVTYSANNSALLRIRASGSGVATADVTASDMPSGGTVLITTTIVYEV